LDRHRQLLQKIPRLRMIYSLWNRMGKDEKKLVLAQANTYLNDLNRL
jgi:deoxyribodipyrimidine photolyase-like uncharacterized protein